MAMPEFTMRQLLEAGVHFGHNTKRWNPKMKPFIFGVRNNIHILDLQQTVPMLDQALKALREISAKGGRVLFVGTKQSAAEKVAETANHCGQYFVNHRWLGGMLTNWKTVSQSITRLRVLEELAVSEEAKAFTKKELLQMSREKEKLHLTLGGINDMGGQPDAVIVFDTNMEDIAILEAKKLGIPVFAIIDSNSNPDNVDYPIPGNDDALRSIELYCSLFADTILDGMAADLAKRGVDTGADVNAGVDIKALEDEATNKADKAAAQKAPKADAKVKKPVAKTEDKAEAKTEAEPKAEAKTEAKSDDKAEVKKSDAA